MYGKLSLVSLFINSIYPRNSMSTNIKKDCSTQTSSGILFDQNVVSLNKENRNTYVLALRFINECHQLMNKMLLEIIGNVSESDFKFPEIPCYVSLYPLISKDNESQETIKQYPIIDIMPEVESMNLLTRNFSSELNIVGINKECTRILQNNSVNAVVQNIPSKHFAISSKSEEIKHKWFSLEADNSLEAKSDNFNINGKKKTVDVDTQVSKKKFKLEKSCFTIVNITPFSNLLRYPPATLNTQLNTRGFKETPVPPVSCFIVKSTTIQKVKNMFDMISRQSNSKLDLNEEIAEKSERNSVLYDEDSEEDSVIFNDNEFEEYQRSKCKKLDRCVQLVEKPNPFRLSSKELERINQETLSAIGLFTNKGELKPDILNLMKVTKQNPGDSRNKQFRTKRLWDVEYHLDPKKDLENKSVPSTSSEIISYCSDVKLQITNGSSQTTSY